MVNRERMAEAALLTLCRNGDARQLVHVETDVKSLTVRVTWRRVTRHGVEEWIETARLRVKGADL